jgi:hypothetical protein
MGITPQFTVADVKERCDKFVEVVEEEQVKLMSYLGEKCLIEARNFHGYTDQTGALTSSMGYVILKDGVAIKEFFGSPREGSEKKGRTTPQIGLERGQEFAKSLTDLYREDLAKGLILIVLAGMNYAIYVESKGFNVLSSAQHLAEQELPRMLKDLIDDIKSA